MTAEEEISPLPYTLRRFSKADPNSPRRPDITDPDMRKLLALEPLPQYPRAPEEPD